jgi:hypothetical protein
MVYLIMNKLSSDELLLDGWFPVVIARDMLASTGYNPYAETQLTIRLKAYEMMSDVSKGQDLDKFSVHFIGKESEEIRNDIVGCLELAELSPTIDPQLALAANWLLESLRQ